MRSSKWFVLALLSAFAMAAHAAQVDFKDPKRAVGREDNIKVDAQLNDDTISSSSPVTITYQIENLGQAPIAVADKIADSDYDPESETITLSIGAEIPSGDTMPHLVVIKSGEKRTLTCGAFAHIATPSIRTPWTVFPRYVEIKVTVLRNVTPFVRYIEKQATSAVPQPFPTEMFDRWVEGSESVYLNAIPIRWKNDRVGMDGDRSPSSGTY